MIEENALYDIMLPPEAGRRVQRPSTTCSSGRGTAALDPNVAAPDLHVRPDRDVVRQPLVQPRLRQAVRPAEPRARRRTAQEPHRPDAEPVLRPGAVPHPVLRRRARRLPDRRVRGLAEPADSIPACRCSRTASSTTVPDRREGRPAPSPSTEAPAPSGSGGSSAAPAATAIPTPAPAPTASTSSDHAAPAIVLVVVVVIVIAGVPVHSAPERQRGGGVSPGRGPSRSRPA